MEPKLKKDLLGIMKRMFEFQQPTICRHRAAQEVIMLFEKYNALPKEQIQVFAKASCDGVDGDEAALELLDQLLEESNEK